MRKWGEPARWQEGESWSARAEQTAAGSDAGIGGGLEDDGFVFWPSSLGQHQGPRLVQVEPQPRRASGPRPPRRRLVTTVLFVFLFFAGAALTAAAGNEVASVVSSDPPSADAQGAPATDTGTVTTTEPATEPAQTDTTTTTTTETTTATEPTQTEPTQTEPAQTEPAPTDTATTGDQGTSPEGGSGAGDQPSAPVGNPSSGGSSAGDGAGAAPAAQTPPADTATNPAPSAQPSAASADTGSQPVTVKRHQSTPQLLLSVRASVKSSGAHKSKHAAKSVQTSLPAAPRPSEVEHEASPGVESGNVRWINEPLPDPTPPSLRLSAQFARDLRETSAANGLDWAFLLAVLRAERLDSTGQVELSTLQKEAAVLAPLQVGRTDRQALLAYKNDSAFADRVLVLEHYYRALGLTALVKGLEASRDQLAARLLADPRIDIYPGGRDDIASGKLDVRVLAMIAFLSESFGDVRVSCLITGHRLYARPGVISAHIYGRAVDIAALDDTQIYGHQEPGGVTEKAVKQILLLPAEVMPKQVISLLGLGGPSFPLADHADHIHIGY